MSACHIKRENWKRAQEMAEKALARNPKNYKAMFRRGKALGEQGFFERAERILEELIKESPAGKLALLRSWWHVVVPHPTLKCVIQTRPLPPLPRPRSRGCRCSRCATDRKSSRLLPDLVALYSINE